MKPHLITNIPSDVPKGKYSEIILYSHPGYDIFDIGDKETRSLENCARFLMTNFAESRPNRLVDYQQMVMLEGQPGSLLSMLTFEHVVTQSQKAKVPLFVTMPTEKDGKKYTSPFCEPFRMWYNQATGDGRDAFAIPTEKERGYLLDPNHLKKHITPSTKVHVGGGQIMACLLQTLKSANLKAQQVNIMDQWIQPYVDPNIQLTKNEILEYASLLISGRKLDVLKKLKAKDSERQRKCEYHLTISKIFLPEVPKIVYNKLDLP